MTLTVLTLVNDDTLLAGLVANLELHLAPFRLATRRGATSMAAGCNALAAATPGAPDDVLCFIHQDARLFFDAATLIPEYLGRLPDAGVLGFCGSNAQQPGRQWHACPPCYGGLLQGGDAPVAIDFARPACDVDGLRYAPVQTLDGYCLFVRRDVFLRIGGFDEGYDGWHGYDLDLCLRALRAGLQNYVIAQPSQHFSWGSSNDDLARSLQRFAQQWPGRLPTPSQQVATTDPATSPTTPRKLRIHIYAIARDEAKFAARFARSCAGADGVHVLDTGSGDDTVAILRAHGVHVEVAPITPWRFDLARNRSLELVPDDADVCLCIDLDEVLVPDWRHIVEAAWVPGTTHLDYQYAWEMRDGKPHRTFHYNKCHSRHGYVWVTPVHEVITPVAGFAEVFASTGALLVEHHPDPHKSRAQYLSLLELAVREDAGDARSRFYLGREYTYVGRWQDAIDTLTRYLERPGSWRFERCSACLMIAASHGRLRELAQAASDADAAARHDGESFRWLLRACHEEPDQREPWVALADACRLKGDHAGSYWAAKKALAIATSAKSYLNDPDAWSWKPHDLLSIAAWYLGLRAEALEHGLLAVECNPHDARLIDNYLLIQELAAAAPPAAGGPVVDVVVLSYAKSAREYEMTKRCIKSLHNSSPDVPIRVVVVETHGALRDEPFTAGDPALFGPGVDVVHPGGRFGYNAYLGAGYRACAGSLAPYLMVLNNDVTLFGNGFLRQMLQGLVVADSVSPLGLREAQWGLVDRSVPIDLGYDINRAVCGWCLMFDTSILSTVAFDALFPPEELWYGQDEAYAAALEAHGLVHGLVTSAQALHLQAASHPLLGQTLAAPADRRDMLRSLGIRGNKVAVVGGAGDGAAPEFAELAPADLRYAASHAVATDVGERSLDFVYIEARHAADHPAAELRAWWPKLKDGGWITGGGYATPAVAGAVAAFCAENDVPLAFVTRDTDPCWAIQVPARSA